MFIYKPIPQDYFTTHAHIQRHIRHQLRCCNLHGNETEFTQYWVKQVHCDADKQLALCQVIKYSHLPHKYSAIAINLREYSAERTSYAASCMADSQTHNNIHRTSVR